MTSVHHYLYNCDKKGFKSFSLEGLSNQRQRALTTSSVVTSVHRRQRLWKRFLGPWRWTRPRPSSEPASSKCRRASERTRGDKSVSRSPKNIWKLLFLSNYKYSAKINFWKMLFKIKLQNPHHKIYETDFLTELISIKN